MCVQQMTRSGFPSQVVVAFIKNKEFDKAEEMLDRYFPESRVGKVSDASCLAS